MVNAHKTPFDVSKVTLVDAYGEAVASASGGASQEDGSAFTPGSSSFNPVGGIREDTPTQLADGEAGIARVNADREFMVEVANPGDIGGGTQYTEGDTDASITGTAILWEDASDTLVAASAAKPLPVDGSGVTQPVSGTFWQATQPVSAASLPLPTGAATAANQSTIIGHVDGIEALLGTIDADTGGILTAVQLLDNLVKLEDDAHQTADPGVMLLAVRQDTQADFGADGDYVPLSINGDGELRVTMSAGSGGTAANDDDDFTDGSTAGTPAMGVYESTPSTVTDGDLGIVGITEDRRLKVLADLGAVDNAVLDAIETAVEAIQAAQLPDGHNVTVDNASIAITHAALTELAAAIDTEVQVDVVGALPAGDNNIGNVDIASAIPAGTNNIGDVDVLSAVATDFEHFSNLDVDTTAEQLTAFACKFGVQIKADDDNTDSVYVGKSDVTAGDTDATDGFRLKAGQGVFLPVSNANLVYVIGGAVNQKVFVVAA